MRHSTLGAATLAVLATWGTVTAGIALRQQGLFRSIEPDLGVRRRVGLSASFIVSNDSGQTGSLADQNLGACTYVIVYRSNCVNSQISAEAFLSLAQNSSGLLPATWRLAILALDSLEANHRLRTLVPPTLVYGLVGGDRRAAELGIGITPSHLVLDRSGVLVSAGLGTALWQPDWYQSDCRIRMPGDSIIGTPLQRNRAGP